MAFLLTVPFAQGFDDLDWRGRTLFTVSLSSAAASVVCLIAPTVLHRVGDRTARRERLQWAIRLLVDHLTGPLGAQATGRSIAPWFWLLGGIAVVLALSSALRYFFVTKLGERIVADLRKATYAHILTLDPAFFLATKTGEVLSRLTTDIQIVENLLTTSISVSLRNLLMLVGGMGYMLVISPTMTGLVLAIFPFVIAPMFLFGRRVRSLTASTQDQFAQAIGHAGETLDALEIVQAFGREASGAASFGQAVETSFRTSLRRMRARDRRRQYGAAAAARRRRAQRPS